jgi:acyl-CoA thioester hydrolase
VRYSEVDSQGWVYNTRYLEYVDHAVTMWMRAKGVVYEELRHDRWDFVLRHAEADWLLPARADECLDVTVELSRMGNSSFDVASEVLRDSRVPLFRARITYVTLDPTTNQAAPTPDSVRAALARSGLP